jgi:hypothetical protein
MQQKMSEFFRRANGAKMILDFVFICLFARIKGAVYPQHLHYY